MHGDGPPVIAGLVSGLSLILLLTVTSSSFFEHYGPPTMLMLVEGKENSMGYGSYVVRRPFGGGFGADVDNRLTMPKEIVSISRDSVVYFSFGTLTLARNVQLRNVWVLDSSNNQYFLEMTDLGHFKVPSDIPDGEYVLTATAVWSISGYGGNGAFSSKIRLYS